MPDTLGSRLVLFGNYAYAEYGGRSIKINTHKKFTPGQEMYSPLWDLVQNKLGTHRTVCRFIHFTKAAYTLISHCRFLPVQ